MYCIYMYNNHLYDSVNQKIYKDLIDVNIMTEQLSLIAIDFAGVTNNAATKFHYFNFFLYV